MMCCENKSAQFMPRPTNY